MGAQVSVGLTGWPESPTPIVNVRSFDPEDAKRCGGTHYASIDFGEGLRVGLPGFDGVTAAYLEGLGEAALEGARKLRRLLDASAEAAQALPQAEAPASSSKPGSHPEGTPAGGTVNWFAGQQIDPVEEDLI